MPALPLACPPVRHSPSARRAPPSQLTQSAPQASAQSRRGMICCHIQDYANQRKLAVKRQLGSFSRLIPGLPSEQTSCTVYKLIVIIAAAMPSILLLRAIFVRWSQKASRAFFEFKKQIDYLVW